MSLASGTKLNHYEILEPVGKGGMGEVYRARDSKLGRDVAIKVLPEELSRDSERSARFEREAKVLASLNHSGIATLYGFEDGFLVMELVEGETLAERIARRPLGLKEAAELFARIADAIEAAHARGVVHRDLKPANIKLGIDGKPKILDFGLARAWSGDRDANVEDSRTPTVTKETVAGAVMGTPAYMSPEQARGEAVDGRADVWAFGCCLYEALTGMRAFPGNTTADVFAAIMNETPQCVTFPNRIRRLLDRCLEKDVHRRLRGLEHARIELEALTGEDDARPRSSRSVAPWLIAVAAFVLAAVGFLRPSPEPPRDSPVRFSLQLPAGDRLLPGFSGNLAISPDGDKIAYVSVRGMEQYSLFLRSMDNLEVEPIPNTGGAGNPFFSPDGRFLGYTSVTGQLKIVALDGGSSSDLVAGADASGPVWGSDGYIYFATRSGAAISRIPAEGGIAETVVSIRDGEEIAVHSPYVLPQADALLFTSRDRSRHDRIEVVSLQTGERSVLIEDANSPHYTPTGHLLFGQEDRLLATRFDVERLTAESNPTVIVEGMQGGNIGPITIGYKQFHVSDSGTLIYLDAASISTPMGQLVRVDRRGNVTPLLETPRRFWDPRWSPNGEKLAVSIYNEQRWDLWTLDVGREALTRLTFEGQSAIRPVWTPDGARLFATGQSVDASQGGEAQPLFASGSDLVKDYVTIVATISPDGNTTVYRQSRPGTGWDIVFQQGTQDTLEVYLATPFDELHPQLSPDGRYLAYTSNDSGRVEVFVDTFPERSNRVQISNDGGTEPVWAHNGSELFYRNGSKMMSVDVRTDSGLVVTRPSVLFEGDFELGFIRQTANYDVSPDGHFAMLRGIEGSRGSEIAVVLNWFSELERLVPTNP